MTSFAELKLAEPLQKALAEEGYTTPTPIQAGSIPYLLEGRDLLGLAQTGTGKTAAFALPILDYLLRHRRPAAPKSVRVLVLAPTRELASQIDESFAAYARHNASGGRASSRSVAADAAHRAPRHHLFPEFWSLAVAFAASDNRPHADDISVEYALVFHAQHTSVHYSGFPRVV